MEPRPPRHLVDRSSPHRCEGDQTEASPRFSHAVLMGRLTCRLASKAASPQLCPTAIPVQTRAVTALGSPHRRRPPRRARSHRSHPSRCRRRRRNLRRGAPAARPVHRPHRRGSAGPQPGDRPSPRPQSCGRRRLYPVPLGRRPRGADRHPDRGHRAGRRHPDPRRGVGVRDLPTPRADNRRLHRQLRHFLLQHHHRLGHLRLERRLHGGHGHHVDHRHPTPNRSCRAPRRSRSPLYRSCRAPRRGRSPCRNRVRPR